MKLLIENWRKFVSEVKNVAKPDYLDLDKDGNKTEPMKKAARDAKAGKKKELEETHDDYARYDYDTPGQDEGPVSFYGVGGTFEQAMDLGMDFPKSDRRNLLDSGTSYSKMLEATRRYGSSEIRMELKDLEDNKGYSGWKLGRALELGEDLAGIPFEDGKFLSDNAKKEWETIKSGGGPQERKKKMAIS